MKVQDIMTHEVKFCGLRNGTTALRAKDRK
jgi:hypothetical protein